ncbi:MAG TPA: acetate/propionate family kinase [Jatrophihabitantaceae bacterium]|nr:acetate/propionate family kinase [Jatrophihabitantaceae bacterium]
MTRILVVNAGSSSLKLRLLGDDDAVLRTADLGSDRSELAAAIEGWPEPRAVGHRVVHGGVRFTGPAVIDADVRREIADLADLAPLHQPKSLAALDEVTAVFPDVPAVACFDTAFHHTIPAAAATYALPVQWRERWPLQRYGFHGLSVAYCARRVAELVPGARRLVVCHLGAGASVTALADGRSVDTTMGFTPLEGLVMATRSGTVDPGLVLWLEEHAKLRPNQVATALEQESGLLGLAGDADIRTVLVRAAAGDDTARLAIDVYVHRLAASIAAMATAARGVDVLVFTGGVGERADEIRAAAVEALDFLGIGLDAAANSAASPDAEVTARGSPARVFVIAAREDLQIAAESRTALSEASTT